MAVNLQTFQESELQLSAEQAATVIRFFFPGVTLPLESITTKDRSFAQALLVEGIDRTYAESYVEALFHNFFMKLPDPEKGIAPLIKSFGKQAFKIWFKHATSQNLQDAQIYENVRSTLSNNFQPEIQGRIQTGEYQMY